ncbi:hypothetical protein BQ9231_00515 [Cedratvirus lausannensis]|uniref:Uncharacterized protein n=1 Tax=Cedratvirus lausannensis TaxID=2023205 RepID=A0A285PXJ9_9VIRU|nr:hypothetical protein BQ9231_00515 [Cedratvirus lausannensis]
MEHGLYEFMSILSSSTICTEEVIYRGTMRHLGLQVGDVFAYSYPTSWTTDIKVATNFIGPGHVILCIEPTCLRALPNPYNRFRKAKFCTPGVQNYNEEEFILYPNTFQVSFTEIYHGIFGDYTLVHLRPT